MANQENPTTTPTSPPPAARPRPCAACKHRRQRCPSDCPLAPYFPQSKQREFLNVHKLFGVNYAATLLKNLQPHLRNDAVKALIFEADCRAADPVGGCSAVVRALHKQIQLSHAELRIVSKNLEFHRARFRRNFNAFAGDHSRKPCLK